MAVCGELTGSDSGRAAYAHKQASLLEGLDSKFAGLWRIALDEAGFPRDDIDDLD